ncbi:MAG: spheroidene monooxygenase [Chitinophagaceae bacterium]|jgi:hypothetical protein
MLTVVYMVRFPKFCGFAGVLSMALFRIVLWKNKNISFYKLMGSGKNGTFDIQPDWLQWCLLVVIKENTSVNYLPSFIKKYWQFFKAKQMQMVLEPYLGHGTWDGNKCFGTHYTATQKNNPIAVLTRASIRFSKLKQFWQHVPLVASTMSQAKGLKQSFGVGEVPFIKQATLSIWEDEASIKNFAYSMQQHKQVVQKTRAENWYSEDMFTRFNVLEINGSLK